MVTWLCLPQGIPARSLPTGVKRHIAQKYGKSNRAQAASFAAYEALTRLYRRRIGDSYAQLPDIDYMSNGRPFFAAKEAACFRFSLTHTEGLSMAVLSDQGRVGIDAEYLTYERYDLHIRLAKSRFFAGEDMGDALDRHSQTREILTLWTKKEAIAKALDMPLRMVSTKPHGHDLHVQSGLLMGHTVFSLAFE